MYKKYVFLALVGFCSSNIVSMDKSKLLNDAAAPIHSFLCEHLDDEKTPLPRESLTHLIRLMKETGQPLSALTVIKDQRKAKPWKEYKFRPNNPADWVAFLRLKHHYHVDFGLLLSDYGFTLRQELYSDNDNKPIKPVGILICNKLEKKPRRFDFVDMIDPYRYPRDRVVRKKSSGPWNDPYDNHPDIELHLKKLNLHPYNLQSYTEDEISFRGQGLCFRLFYSIFDRALVTVDLLRLLMQCKRVKELNRLFEECERPQKSPFSSSYLSKRFHNEVEKYHKRLLEGKSSEDKSNEFMTLLHNEQNPYKE